MNARTLQIVSSAAVACLALAIVPAASGGMVTWDVDPASSFVRLTIPDQTKIINSQSVPIRFRDASSSSQWTDAGGRRAALDGTLQTDYIDGVSVQFLTGAHGLFALEETSLRPNPAAFDPLATNDDNPEGQYSNSSTAPAAFGARVIASASLITPTTAHLALRNVLFDLESGIVPLGGGTAIGAETTAFGMTSANLDLDGLALAGIQVVPDLLNSPFSLDNTSNLATGSVTSEGGNLRKLTLNISTPLVIDIEGVLLNGTATGVIVAYSTAPEPSTITLMGLALLGLGVRALVATRRRAGLASIPTTPGAFVMNPVARPD